MLSDERVILRERCCTGIVGRGVTIMGAHGSADRGDRMTIAMDADDMSALSTRLEDAAEKMVSLMPATPASSVFGPAVLGGAVVAFDASMRRQAIGLQNSWTAVATGVDAALDDMTETEARIRTYLERLTGAIA